MPIRKLIRFLHPIPFPQAHIYANDPFQEEQTYHPNRMMRVDFAFWTGKQLVAVEIDGSSHIGSVAHIEKDRMLQRAGIYVIHILNEEFEKHGTKVIKNLLPTDIVQVDYFSILKSMGVTSGVNPYEDPFESLFNPFAHF